MSADLKQFNQFLTLAETGSFRRTAELLNMAQPPLSISIKKLEESFGCELFARHVRGVTLTDAGLAALPYIKQAVVAAAQAKEAAQGVSHGIRGELRVGFVGSATYDVLPRLVPVFRRAFPDVRLVFFESTTVQIAAGLRNGTYDVGFARSPLLSAESENHIILTQDEMCVAVPVTSELAGRPSITLRELKDYPFICHSSSEVPGLNYLFHFICDAAGFTPRIEQEAAQIQTLVSLVESGLGVAVVPSCVADHPRPAVRFIPLVSSVPVQTGIALLWREEEKIPLVRHFYNAAIEVFQRKESENNSRA